MKKIFLAIVLAFSLNFVWEVAQSFLYAPHYQGLGQLISVHLWASLGDVVMVATILSVAEIVSRYILKNKNKKLELLVITLVGFLLATVVENYALVNSMWAYNSLMPVLPWLKVGLTPVLQLMLIPAAIWIFLKSKVKYKSN
jgi:hypothetical protein